jgi:hypothetical protein
MQQGLAHDRAGHDRNVSLNRTGQPMPAKKRNPLVEATRIGTVPTPAGASLLPQKQDESVAMPAPPQPVMIQAQRDVARGLEDTDCYSRLGKLIPQLRRK